MRVVGRAKKCLDYTLTMYGGHFFWTVVYGGIPKRWEWWGVQTVSMIATVVLSEYLCWQREMEDIPRTEEEDDVEVGLTETPRHQVPDTPGRIPKLQTNVDLKKLTAMFRK